MSAWTGERAAAIAIGGAMGAGARWLVVRATDAAGFPWPVFAVNVAGSLVLGMLLAIEPEHARHRVLLHDFGAIGVCGGLTTFSTFAVEVADLGRRGELITASTYTIASVAAAIVAVTLGALACRRVIAAASPVEGEW